MGWFTVRACGLGKQHNISIHRVRSACIAVLDVDPIPISIGLSLCPVWGVLARALFQAFVLTHLGGLASFWSSPFPPNRFRSIHLANRGHILLPIVTSEFGKDLGYPADKQASRTIRLGALGKLTVRGRWSTRYASEESKSLANLINHKERLKASEEC